MRGRKPLPKELLQLRGTDRKDRDRPASVSGEKIALADVGKCQISGLQSATRRARDIYWRTVRKVAALGMLEESFLSQIFFYAIEYDHLMTCNESIRKEGIYITVEGKKGTFVVPNPAVKQRDKALEILMKIGSNFGFSPVDKQRIRVQTEPEKPGDRIKRIFASIEYEDGETVDEQ
ncbi:MAG: P27 family phage terminase small subunit [Bacteroidales bacterium]|nr:P27 family phage terminase small subunit [Bacteroidales bacterium]